MNKIERKKLNEIGTRLEGIKKDLDDIKSDLELMAEKEQKKFDNLPFSLQETERGESLQNCAESLYEIAQEVEYLEMDSIIQMISDIPC